MDDLILTFSYLLLSFNRRFGFTNQDALAAGETGTACRGEEHDITLIWSLTSGKRLVLADGQEVHYSNSRSQVFDFSFHKNHRSKLHPGVSSRIFSFDKDVQSMTVHLLLFLKSLVEYPVGVMFGEFPGLAIGT